VEVLAPDVVELAGVTFSPDGNHIYFVRSDKSTSQFRYLYEMPVLGGSPRQLIRDLDTPIDFSPDGNQFVFQRGIPAQDVVEIHIAQSDGSGEKILATFPANTTFQYGPAWSPNGKTIAVPTLGTGKDINWAVNVINVADGRVRQLISTGARYIGRPVWTASGDALVATVSETPLGRGQLQIIDYPSGAMHRFTNDLSDYTVALDITRDRKTLAAIQRNRISDVWTAPAADATQARQVTSGGTVYGLVVPGPSGKLLATGNNGDLWLMNPDGGARSLLVPQTHNLFSVTSCGDRYLVFDSYRGGKVELWRSEVDGSNATKMLDDVRYPDCSPDGKWIYYLIRDKLYRMPPEGGASAEVVAVPGGSAAWLLRVSPNGDQVGFVYQEGSPVPMIKVASVPVTGGPLQFTSPLPFGFAGLRWAPSGKALDYLLTRNGATNVWEQPLTAGAPRQITTFTSGRIFDFAWSRDGKLLLTKGNLSSDVILISSFQ